MGILNTLSRLFRCLDSFLGAILHSDNELYTVPRGVRNRRQCYLLANAGNIRRGIGRPDRLRSSSCDRTGNRLAARGSCDGNRAGF